MATPRKHWFRVADTIQFEPWSNDVLATCMRLMATMNTRWARDGLSPEDACTITLMPAELMSVTGSVDRRTALRRIHLFAMSVTAYCHEVDTMRGVGGKACRITWPKYAEFQGLAARESPPPQDARRKTHTQEEEKKTEPPASAVAPTGNPKRAVSLRTTAPESLDDDSLCRLGEWCAEKYPEQRAWLPDLVDACLTFHRGKGNRHADWYATCQTWVRNEVEQRFGRPRAPDAPRSTQQTFAEMRTANTLAAVRRAMEADDDADREAEENRIAGKAVRGLPAGTR